MLYSFIYLISLLPFRLLYAVSDVMAWLAYDVIKYRRRVVSENLRSSFPEKSPQELRRIEKKFYKFLGDYFIETIKLASMSEEKMKRHMVVENPEEINDATAKGQSYSLYLGHYCNWEWVSSLPIWSTVNEAYFQQLYHPLENKVFDRMMTRLRTRFGAHNIPMNDIMPNIVRLKKEGVPTVTGYIADQAPGLNIHLFLSFLNHETGVYTGAERISKFLNAKVGYAHITRPRRGYYRLRIIPICDDARREEIFEISRRYFELLENNIREAPQYWLWSHRRWKRSRAMFESYHGDKAADMLTHL